MGAAVLLLNVFGGLAKSILSQATSLKWPQDILDALLAASNAISQAHSLAVTKQQLEDQRG